MFYSIIIATQPKDSNHTIYNEDDFVIAKTFKFQFTDKLTDHIVYYKSVVKSYMKLVGLDPNNLCLYSVILSNASYRMALKYIKEINNNLNDKAKASATKKRLLNMVKNSYNVVPYYVFTFNQESDKGKLPASFNETLKSNMISSMKIGQIPIPKAQIENMSSTMAKELRLAMVRSFIDNNICPFASDITKTKIYINKVPMENYLNLKGIK